MILATICCGSCLRHVMTPSPVVELNRAVAVAMARGPAAGLEIVDALVREPALQDYHLLPAVRADLLEKLGRFREACAEFERAAALTGNSREQQLLQSRAAAARESFDASAGMVHAAS
jgi:RNA polymerase sigma-70 factor, ECF subfamily